ncbi:MAG TPA: hypothetical protein VII72_17220 [Myxococcota bacterium]
MPHRTRSLLARFALAAGSLAFFFGLLELFARHANSEIPERLARADALAVAELEQRDPELFWRYRPNQEVEKQKIRVRTNDFGLRDRARTREKPAGVFRILSLGESTTFGENLEATETYSFLLEQLLEADGTLGRGVEVWNCGICSYTTYQSVKWLERDGLSFQPDLVLFYHEMNDFLPTYHRTGDGQALGLGRTDRELAALRGRLGPLILLLENSHFYRWLRIRVLLAASRALAPALEPRGRVFQETGSPEYDPALRLRMPWKTLPIAPADPKAWPDPLPYMENPNPLCRVPDPDRLALLSELVQLLRGRGVDLVLIHPAYQLSRPHRCVLTELARREGVPVVEMERIVAEAGVPKNEAFFDIYHPKAALHRRLAEELARVVRPRIPPAPADVSSR